MKPHRVIIAVALVLFSLVVAIAIQQYIRLTDERALNAKLERKIESLESDITKLRQTADYFFRRGVDLESAENLQEAKTAFETVLAKFPASKLVGPSQQRLAVVNAAIVQAETEERRRHELKLERERERESGAAIDYVTFFVLLHKGMQEGKRYRISATLSHNFWLARPGTMTDEEIRGKPAFDDGSQYEAFLRGPDFQTHTVVVSMGSDGNVLIHKVE
jgi:hypothetical protein